MQVQLSQQQVDRLASSSKMGKNKKILIFLFLLFLTITVTVGISLAWFSYNDQTTNIATMGKLEIKLNETSNETDAVITDDGIVYTDSRMPGDEISKIVEAENIGNKDVYIRYVIDKGWYDPVTGNKETGTNGDLIELINIDSSKYIVIDDGDISYFYLKSPLLAGTKDNLFRAFKVSLDTTNDYMGLQAKIKVTVDAIQFEYGAEAISAEGWPVKVDLGTKKLIEK